MAYYFITASKDASIYLRQPYQNYGFDEVLEIGKTYDGAIRDVSRTLIKFDTSYVSQSISNGSISLSSAELLLRETDSEELPLSFNIECYAVSQSWEMGKGTRFTSLEIAGTTWNYRNGATQQPWLTGSGFSAGSTGSYDGNGGTFYTDVYSVQPFEYMTQDIRLDIKPIFLNWISGSKPNDGIILKFPFEYEEDDVHYGTLKFFSKETNTIHQPKVAIGWDDSSFNTGSFSVLSESDGDITVGIRGFKKEYKLNTVQRIRVLGRLLYPPKTFNSVGQYDITSVLPSTSYYQVSDYLSKDVIIPYGDYSKISCDSIGNYFTLNFSNWEVNRPYKIEIKIVRNGLSEYFDGDYVFNLIP